jgi:subtilisin family serine protease
MRRIATLPHFRLLTTLVITTALVLSAVPAYSKSKAEHRVIIKVTDVSRIKQLEKKYGFKARKFVARGTDAIFVVEDIPLIMLKNSLKNEAGISFVVKDDILPLDSGETVLPLGSGEGVLPLDGSETVLALGTDTDLFIAQLLGGGETVLALEELSAIRNAYAFLSQAVTPSAHLILQPGFRKIGLYPSVPRATGRGVVIADLDTGADTCHEVLHGVVTYTFVEGPDANAPENCPTPSTVPVPGYGHGTRVASLLRLVAPESTLWAMRVFDNSGSAQTSDIYEAVVFAADHGVDVINMSFGTSQPSEALADAMDYARERGVVLIAAGGNSNGEPLMYPAQISGVKGVVAVTNSDIKVSFSNYGSRAYLSAPGYGLWVAEPNHKIAYVAGTSYASPLVAGEAALIIDGYQRTHSGTTPSAVIDLAMQAGAVSINLLNPQYLFKLGRGRIYIPGALNAIGLQ